MESVLQRRDNRVALGVAAQRRQVLQRAVAAADPGRRGHSQTHVGARLGNGRRQTAAAGQQRGDRRAQRAARAVRVARREAPVREVRDHVALDEDVGDDFPAPVAALDEHRPRAQPADRPARFFHALNAAHGRAAQRLGLGGCWA